MAPFAEPQSHERRRYVAERSRTSGMAVSATSGATTLDLSNPRFNNTNSCQPPSLPSQSGVNQASDSQAPKALPLSRNRAAGSFTKQTIK